MALFSDQALVVGRVLYGDSDCVVTLLTEGHGLQPVFARGARRSRPRFGTALELFVHLHAQWRARGQAAMPSLVVADQIDDHRGLRGDLDRMSLAQYATEAVRWSCQEAEPVPEVFALLLGMLDLLAAGNAGPALWAAFQIKLLDLLGFGPELGCCVGCRSVPPPSRSVLLFLEEGGVLCRACRREREDGLLLSWPSLDALRRLRSLPLGSSCALPLPPQAPAQLRALLPRALQHVLGRALKSLELIRF